MRRSGTTWVAAALVLSLTANAVASGAHGPHASPSPPPAASAQVGGARGFWRARTPGQRTAMGVAGAVGLAAAWRSPSVRAWRARTVAKVAGAGAVLSGAVAGLHVHAGTSATGWVVGAAGLTGVAGYKLLRARHFEKHTLLARWQARRQARAEARSIQMAPGDGSAKAMQTPRSRVSTARKIYAGMALGGTAGLIVSLSGAMATISTPGQLFGYFAAGVFPFGMTALFGAGLLDATPKR